MNQKVTSASTVAEQKSWQTFCLFKNFIHLCSDNVINECIHAKILSNNKKAAYGCKSRDFSISIDVVSSDCLFFIYQ